MSRFAGERVVVPELLRRLGINAERRGDAWWSPCPLPGHAEKEPSWKINDCPGADKNSLQWCFGCGRGGTAAELVSDVIGISVPGARDWLMANAMGAPTFGTQVVIEVAPAVAPGSSAFRMPREVLFGPLTTWIGPPRAYAEKRGVTARQVDEWGIGYAVEGSLAGRVVFPILDSRGRHASYSARTFVGSPKRYLTPPRALSPNAGAVHGEHLWPATANRFAVVLTEGALKTLAVQRALDWMRSAGIAGAWGVTQASLGGSAVSLRQVLSLSTFPVTVVMTDPDLAGDRAAGMILGAIGHHRDVRRVRLPRGTDPDTLAMEDLVEWIALGLGLTI